MGEIVNLINVPVISILISSGGLGFISFVSLNKMGKLNVYDNQDSFFYNIFLSIVNFIIMFVITLILNLYLNIQLSFIISLIITMLIAAIYPFVIPLKLIDKIKKNINNSRNKEGLAYQNSEPIREKIFNNSKDTIVYIFDFEKNLINCGYITKINTHKNEPNEIGIDPFDEESPMKTFDDINEYVQQIDVKSEILINLEDKTQIYFIEA